MRIPINGGESNAVDREREAMERALAGYLSAEIMMRYGLVPVDRVAEWESIKREFAQRFATCLENVRMMEEC